ncbi:MAG: hypothetical protein KF868_09165 [Acidobacteria bacterium]|nr:hypothetical protein [Acidobacteriota bacterium]MCW5968334.1 hypothetical protein [Blastocatellales bacterium]
MKTEEIPEREKMQQRWKRAMRKPETTLILDVVPAYIESRDGGYYVAGTPISLESVIYQFKEGLSPETIQHECFLALTLEQVYGVCTYYLRHKEQVEEYLQEAERDFKRLAEQLEAKYPGLLRSKEHLRQLRERAANTQPK